MKKYLMPGKVCTIDPKNKLKQFEDGEYTVVLIEKMNHKLFGNAVWKVQKEDGIIDYIKEKYLYPSGMCVVRNPIQMPFFTNDELISITKLIEVFNSNNTVSTLQFTDEDKRNLAYIAQKMKTEIELTGVQKNDRWEPEY